MSLRDLPKSLIDAVCEVVSTSTEQRQKLVNDLRVEGLRRFGVKRESQLTEADQKALHAWVQIKLDEASCGCGEDIAQEDHMPGDEVLYNKDGEIKKQMDEDDAADKDYDGDGEVESSSDEYLGSKDKAIKAAMKNEEESDEVSEEDEVELKENVAVDSKELATNGAVAVADASKATPKHADVIRDTDPYTNVTEYRVLLQYATNEGTRIYPPVTLPGARSVADLRTLVEGLPDFNEAVDAALVHASSTDINAVQESISESVKVVFTHTNFGAKKTKTSYSVKSADELAKQLNISRENLFASDDDEKLFADALKKSSVVYAFINPYHQDINNTDTVSLAKTLNQAEKDFDDAAGDI